MQLDLVNLHYTKWFSEFFPGFRTLRDVSDDPDIIDKVRGVYELAAFFIEQNTWIPLFY